MSEIKRECIKEFNSLRIVKVSYDSSNPIFIIEQSSLNALKELSWNKLIELTKGNSIDNNQYWLYQLLQTLK